VEAGAVIADAVVPAEMIIFLNRFADEQAGRAEQGGLVLSDAKHARVSEMRRSDVVWLEPSPAHKAVYDFVAGFVNKANAEAFRLQIQTFDEPFQIATYTAEARGFYGWHVDIGAGRLATRKLSIVIPLTSPGEYEGGRFEVFNEAEPTPIEMPLGRIVAFPSYLLHRVTPVTRGMRRTMAVWVSGPPFS
jgi:PKHD-type hydroxylase